MDEPRKTQQLLKRLFSAANAVSRTSHERSVRLTAFMCIVISGFFHDIPACDVIKAGSFSLAAAAEDLPYGSEDPRRVEGDHGGEEDSLPDHPVPGFTVTIDGTLGSYTDGRTYDYFEFRINGQSYQASASNSFDISTTELESGVYIFNALARSGTQWYCNTFSITIER